MFEKKYEYRLRRAREAREKWFLDPVIMDKNELALYVASAEFQTKEQGKLSCADYTKENLVHYLNDHTGSKITCPNLYDLEQGIKFDWEDNWVANLFSKFYENNIDPEEAQIIEKMMEKQVWDKYLPAYQTTIANTIRDYNEILSEPAFCLGGDTAYGYIVYEQLENKLKKEQKNHDGIDFYKLFRKSFIAIMNEKFGIDEKLTAISLEKKAELWRSQVMLKTYEKKVGQKGLQYFVPDKYKESLLKMFEYEYYQDNKKIIDELGVATDNMKLNTRQVERLKAMIKKYEQKAIKKKEHYNKPKLTNLGISVFKKKHMKEITNQKNHDDGRIM